MGGENNVLAAAFDRGFSTRVAKFHVKTIKTPRPSNLSPLLVQLYVHYVKRASCKNILRMRNCVHTTIV